MVPHIAPTRLLELMPSDSDPESVLTACVLTTLFILASAFDMSFGIVSAMVLILTLPTTRLIASAALCAARSILVLAHSAAHNLWLSVASSSLCQAIARHLEDATPVLVILLTVLASWTTLSSFCLCDVSDKTGPPSPGPPKGRAPMAFSPARGLPVLKLPSEETPTPRGERERRYLEIISSLEAKMARRAKRMEKLTLKLEQAPSRQAIDASIADRDRTIAKNADVIAEKEVIIGRLTEDVRNVPIRSQKASVLSMLARLCARGLPGEGPAPQLHAAEERFRATVAALHARIEALEADLRTARAQLVAQSSAVHGKTTIPPEGTTALREEECFARQAAAVVLKNELIASLQTDLLKLQRELDSAHCRLVEKDALLAIQTSTVNDLQSDRDATARSAQAQTRLIKELNDKLAAYEQEAADRWLSEHHLPPDDLETCNVGTSTDVLWLTQQLSAAKQEALDATRLQQAYEEVADAGAVRVIELVEKLEEQKELSEVDRELFLARIRKLTALVENARSGIPVPDKTFAQLRLPTTTSSTRVEDSFTTVTPRLRPSSSPSSPSASPRSARKLRRRSAIENLREPLAGVTTSATTKFAPPARQSVPRSRLPRPSSLSFLNTQSPPALIFGIPSP